MELPARLPESATDGRGICFLCERADPFWWSQTGSNRRPPACKAGALPTELWPRTSQGIDAQLARSDTPDAIKMVGLGRLELPTSRLSSARSNQLSYKPGFMVRRTAGAAAGDITRGRHPHNRDAAHIGGTGLVREEREKKTAASCRWAYPSENEFALMFPRDPIETNGCSLLKDHP